VITFDDILERNLDYIEQHDFYAKGLLCSFGIFSFLEIVRNQIAEINVLQLVPGFYLILLFFSFLFVLFSSDTIFRLPVIIDNQKFGGTKTIRKIEITLFLRISFFLAFSVAFASCNTVLPLSLDFFNTYGEKTMENYWSLDEILTLEIFLLLILFVISQIPVFILSSISTEKTINSFPNYWKGFSFFIFLIAGFLTPTIDGYTQISFAGCTLSLYAFTINFLRKRTLHGGLPFSLLR